MGMECTAAIRSSSPVAFVRQSAWFNNQRSHDHPDDQQNQQNDHPPTTSPHSSLLQHFCTSPPSLGLGFCRRAASFPLASAALQQAQSNAGEETASAAVFAGPTSAPQRPSSLLLFGPALKVRSQSESAALNKLAQMDINRIVPHSMLDEFQWQNRLQHFREQSTTTTGTAMNTSSSNGNRQQREVKFFAQQPLQSDSEGEDSVVSTPDDEPSPTNSCAEEEYDDEVQLEKEERPSSSLPITTNVAVDPDQFDVEEEDLGLGPMDEDIERDRDRLAARTFEQQLKDAIEELPHRDMHRSHSPLLMSPSAFSPSFDDSSLLEVARCDDSGYATVPSMMASLDIAQPAQPSPMIQLPLQLPLVTIDLTAACANALDVSAEKPSCIKEEAAEEKVEGDDQILPLRQPPKKPRRQVRFADDCGQCLETVRVMTEPSDYPPKISPAVIRRYRRAAALSMQKETAASPNGQTSPGSQSHAGIDDSDELDSDDSEKGPRSTWKLGFKQPASEYVKFRETLDSQKVALENVMLKNEQGRMIGTIKVANIAFEKEVFIRLTANRWKTNTDKPAQYQSSPSKTFDTFRFDIEIPRNEAKDSRLEFCVCFLAKNGDGQQEYWDSNGGRNFALCSPEPETPSPPLYAQKQQPPTPMKNASKPRNIAVGGGTQIRLDREDPYRMDWNSPNGWSSTNFAAWRQLSTEGPYWSSCAAPLTPPLPSLIKFGQGIGGMMN